MNSEIKTRVAPRDELHIPKREGQDCLVIIYSSDPRMFGRRHVLATDLVLLGRGNENHIVLENDSVSRRHAKIERRGEQYFVADLGSTNGTYVNDELIRTEFQLRRSDQLKIGNTIIKYLSGSDVEAQYHETIYRMTIEDGLTGVNNKRYLQEALDREIPRARRHERPLALLMLDVDHFKEVNDTFGHLAGDFILKELAQILLSRLRPDDVLGRYGGEEFAVLLPETAIQGAVHIGEDLRRMIEQHTFEFEQERMRVTLSGGAAHLEADWDSEQLIRAADRCLYAAKRSGRNRICS